MIKCLSYKRSTFTHLRRAFTLIELLIVIGIIGTLASVTIVAINPNKQLNAAKDAARLQAANQLQKALQQYAIDNQTYPNNASISTNPLTPTLICKQGITNAGCVNIDAIVPIYITQIPQDPLEDNANYSGYMVANNAGRAQVRSEYVNFISDGLVAFWKFNESIGTSAKDSKNANDGTLINGPAWVAGKMGNGISFNGTNSYVSAPHVALDNRSFTITGWIKANNLAASQTWFGQIDSLAGTKALHLRLLTTGALYFGFFGWDLPTAAGIISPGTWYHVAYVYTNTSPSVRQIYANGILLATDSPPPFTGTVGATNIGVWDPSVSEYWNGFVDDVRVYNRALSASEIQQIAAGNG